MLIGMLKDALISILNLGVKFVNLLVLAISKVGKALVVLLPPTPFNVIENLEIPYLDTLNWVMPVSFMITVLTYWVGAIAIYYIVSVGLRWVKAVQ